MTDDYEYDYDDIEETPDEAGYDEPEVQEDVTYYHKRLWKGTLYVYVCERCGQNKDEEDDMIIHVLGHYPANERDEILEKLLVKE